jgi:hypothetical protein
MLLFAYTVKIKVSKYMPLAVSANRNKYKINVLRQESYKTSADQVMAPGTNRE